MNATRVRLPAARTLRNTALMLDAATQVLADPGWRGFNFHQVAHAMGVSEQPIRNRVDSRESLAAVTWRQRLADPLAAALDEVLDHAGGDGLVDTLRWFREPSYATNATAEILVLAQFDATIHEAVDTTLGEYLRRRIASRDEQAAATAYAVSLALGLMFVNRHPDAPWELDDAIRTRARALAQPRNSLGLPDVAAPHLDVDPVLADDDPALQDLLASCLAQVSEHGFDNVSVRQIARRAGYTEGLIYARYAGKQEMFLDAVRRQQQAGWELNHEFVTRLEEEYGDALAEAIQWQQFQRPSRARARALVLEQLRMTWHDDDLKTAWAADMAAFRAALLDKPGWAAFETDGDFVLNVAAPFGLYLLPAYVPGVDLLPYDAVTLPLYEEFRRQSSSPLR